MVGRAVVPKPRVRLVGQPFEQGIGQARLADARLPGQQNHLALAFFGLLETAKEHSRLMLTADQRSKPCRSSRRELALGATFTLHPPSPDRLAKALEFVRPQINEIEHSRD